MRIAERPLAHQLAVAQLAGDRVDHADFERLGGIERRQNPGSRAASIDLPAPGGPTIKSCAAGRRDFERALRGLLALDVLSRASCRGSSAIRGSGGDRTWVPLK